MTLLRRPLDAMAVDVILLLDDAAPGAPTIAFARGPLRARYVLRAAHDALGDALDLARRFGLRTLVVAPARPASAADREAILRAAATFRRVWVVPATDALADAWRDVAPPAREEAPAVMACPACGRRLRGLRCRGHRAREPRVRYERDGGLAWRDAASAGLALPIAPSGCGAVLAWSAEAEALVCPRGCGGVRLHCAAGHGAMAPSDACDAPPEAPDDAGDEPLSMTCGRCGLTVEGAWCVGAAHPDRALALRPDDAHEDACGEYGWSCPAGCGRASDGAGVLRPGDLRCRCDDVGMSPLAHEERYGPPPPGPPSPALPPGPLRSLLQPHLDAGLLDPGAAALADDLSLGDAWGRCDDPAALLVVAHGALPPERAALASLACVEAALTRADVDTDLPPAALEALASRELDRAQSHARAALHSADATRFARSAAQSAATGFTARAVARERATSAAELAALASNAVATLVLGVDAPGFDGTRSQFALGLADEPPRPETVRAALPEAWDEARRALSERVRRAVGL